MGPRVRGLAFFVAALAAAAGCTEGTSATAPTEGGVAALNCSVGQVKCEDGCFEIDTDPENCGACGQKCDAGEVCSDGACAAVCRPGLTDCEGSCKDVLSNHAACGACGKACGQGEVCAEGKCMAECPANLGACGGSCRDLQTDRRSCGDCSTSCRAGEVCDGGLCILSCADPLVNCDGVCRDTTSDQANCGACGSACPGGELCVSGSCMLRCPDGMTQCGGTCANLATEQNNCGACGTACAPGEICTAGECVTTCQFGLTNCSGSCVDVNNDPAHCSACGNACAQGEVCSSGRCRLICQAGLVECSGLCIDTKNDRSNCGRCGTACADGEVCNDGACAPSCAEPFTACDGRCVDPRIDPDNCGGCGVACRPITQATGICVDRSCELRCNGGYEDCNGRHGDGCEIHLDSDIKNCGACGTSCSFGPRSKASCTLGACSLACDKGYLDCDGDPATGCEVEIKDDPKNCGCGVVCKEGEFCVGGKCTNLYTFEGPKSLVKIADLAGWTECYKGTYNQSGAAHKVPFENCTKNNILIACREKDSETLMVAAHAKRDEVFKKQGGSNDNTTHSANGTGWYFNDAWSMGFVKDGDPVTLNSCDTNNTNAEFKLCWHTGGGNLNGGWRCGSTTGLNGNASWERLVYHADDP